MPISVLTYNRPDWELIDSLSLSLKAKPSSTLNKIKQTMHTGKFVLRNKSKMEQTIKELKSWNDSLDSMTEKLTRESSRRQLRSQFSTNDTQKLEQLVAAARFLEHWDIERMASARTLIESFKQEQVMESPIEVRAPSRTQLESKYAFQMKEFEFQGNPFPSDIVRATAWFKGERVIVDWRCCEDDTWRIDNPLAFRQRTESLTKILNSDLEPLNLSILHCLGYFDQNKHITGYAFKPPPGASEKDRHTTLQDALKNLSGFDDVPDVGDRFRLAKALASTLFEIHNLGWIHKNIQPVNILFWPKKGGKELPCVSKPYLMGFDISRPNQPGEMTEKPPFRLEDDIYRHPEYKDREATSFQPSFDVYSLGVVLWEIGLWRKLGGSRQRPSVGSKDLSQWPDRNLINNMIERGEINHLKRFAGTRYRDAVAACFNPDLDAIWKGEVNGDREQKLRRHLDIVRRDIVDVLASCNA